MLSFKKSMYLISFVSLGVLIFLSWGEPNFLGYITAFLAGQLIGGFDLNSLGQSASMDDAEVQAILGSLNESEMDSVMEAINGQKKIKAIKLLRLHAGLGLMDAKNAIETIARGSKVAS